MRRNRWAILVALLLLVSGCSMDSNAVNQQQGGEKRYVAGDGTVSEYRPADRVKTSNITGTLLDGKKFELADYRGTVVVFNFWGQWCAPCRAEADDLKAVYEATKESGVQFIGVNVRDSKDRARAFERTFGITYPSLFDPDGRVALNFRKTPPNSIPATIIIDRQGRVATVFRKALLREDLQPAVEKIAAEQ